MDINKLRKNKGIFVLLALATESLMTWLFLGQQSFFWVMLAIIFATSVIFCLVTFGISVSKVFSHENSYDLAFLVGVVVAFNANIMIIPNIFFLIIALAIYFFGLNSFAKALKKKVSNQARKNAIILAILVLLFLGGIY
jgi:hypothetical protein